MPDVLFVAPDLHGGVGRCVAFIVDALPEQGVDSALFLLRSRNREYPVANPKVTRALPIIESSTKLRLMLPFAFMKLMAQIRRDKPAIVCSHGLLCNMLVVLARKMLGGKFRTVAFEHSSPAIHYGASKMRRLKCWLVSQTYRRHDAVVGVSRGVKEDLVSMFPPLRGKVHTIYNGVPLDNVRRQGAQRTEGDGAAPYHVVAVGRLEAVKDYATLIDAAALLDDPGIAFTILGEGSEHAALQKRIDERASRSPVTLAGHIDNPFPVIASAGAFALTSIRESFGNVLVEALCLGVPVISTDCPHGPAEILDAGRYGLLVPVGDAAALADAVRRLAYDAKMREQLAAQGPERADAFSLERHCRNVIALFQPLMQRGTP
ncbi:Probable poly(glycerol-phosphate) alpha-glucosyltransferase [Achromobacter spanius]|uniref:glycosyltransferase n=1 Tax=Achromobacter spanius TaxID=217203 RepID=UPI000C2BB643|nr:glycosyltransferase [Achromobacter spanius]AUA58768.1 glycosyltransferase [Achromobacter spanius]CAB3660468.1 D-inositol-3-phosphate glycosyltransferase [Achromobacter spanius]SPT40244.1 Probable poly(glycerol-phosphate) alpha-glucosyltransferase [Achromobacter denitrificans]VEE59081.1 Probable poly(glycerol-phosphate) alpha-glucosyltransferase [Achromobacter spanius]